MWNPASAAVQVSLEALASTTYWLSFQYIFNNPSLYTHSKIEDYPGSTLNYTSGNQGFSIWNICFKDNKAHFVACLIKIY